MTPTTRLLQSDDFTAWRPLWQQYLDFYQTDLDETVTRHTWQRLTDPTQTDMLGLGVFVEGRLSGFTHLVFHPNTWSAEPCCYLEDLCVDASMRGQGLGRALIQAAHTDHSDRYSSIPLAAALPAPIASITVAAPVTASPPANTPFLLVCPFVSSATMHLF